jgi:hypothetical protein
LQISGHLKLNSACKFISYVSSCGCWECVNSHIKDTVHHSKSRINAFRALASPSIICLTAKDPILVAFQLSWELRRLSFEEHEFRNEYQVSAH